MTERATNSRSVGTAKAAILYRMARDPMFLVISGVVLLGMVLTLTSYLRDRKEAA
jgi:hypothetical protein